MKTFLALLTLSISTFASADQFKTVTFDDSSKNYYSLLTIHQLLPAAVAKASEEINKNLLSSIRAYGCDAQEAEESANEYDYSVNARLIALNSSYVAYELTMNSYCGGAHPNYATYYMTFNAQTGDEIVINNEVPMQKDEVAYEEFKQYQAEIAEVIYSSADFKKLDNGCFDGLSKKETIEELAAYYPYIAGLAKGKKVVLAVSVSHANTPCAFSVRVPAKDVKHFIAKDSVIREMLKY